MSLINIGNYPAVAQEPLPLRQQGAEMKGMDAGACIEHMQSFQALCDPKAMQLHAYSRSLTYSSPYTLRAYTIYFDYLYSAILTVLPV